MKLQYKCTKYNERFCILSELFAECLQEGEKTFFVFPCFPCFFSHRTDSWFKPRPDTPDTWVQNLHWKLGQQSAICCNSLCLFRDNGLNCIFFRNKTFLFFKIESWNCLKNNLVKPLKISTHSAHSDNFYFHFFYRLSDGVEILWGFTKFFFK